MTDSKSDKTMPANYQRCNSYAFLKTEYRCIKRKGHDGVHYFELNWNNPYWFRNDLPSSIKQKPKLRPKPLFMKDLNK